MNSIVVRFTSVQVTCLMFFFLANTVSFGRTLEILDEEHRITALMNDGEYWDDSAGAQIDDTDAYIGQVSLVVPGPAGIGTDVGFFERTGMLPPGGAQILGNQ